MLIALLALAAGVMAVASIWGLLLPATDRGSTSTVLAGLAVGIAFLVASRLLFARHHLQIYGHEGDSVNLSVLVFAVLFVHSLPEGFAIGTAYASGGGLALFVILAIALQNIPEGTSVAIPMQAAGFSRRQQFWAAVGTSAPQPLGAAVAYLLVEQVAGLLPFSFAFAAGAMLSLVLIELIPGALEGDLLRSAVAFAIGGGVMLALSAALGV